ncbi:MAG: class I SAM-dependent methyltransferase [Chloroflexi bacterium]|nr:class I SAM-dependent methyltransferase [Chloroflexota bacterium]
MIGDFSLEQFYDAYPRVEVEFQHSLKQSLNPRGPEMLYDLVKSMGLPNKAAVVDVGCGEGRHTLQLAARFGFATLGIDPVQRHIQLAYEGLMEATRQHPEINGLVRFQLCSLESLPIDDMSVDLVWCRDVLSHVADLDAAYAEFWRVLRKGGRVLVYQMFATDRLEPKEADWLFKTMGVVFTSADTDLTELAIASAGFHVDERIDVGTEWGEWAEERSGAENLRLLHTARLLRSPDGYAEQFGQRAYEIMLGDALWHVYAMIGKLSRRVYVLSR